MKHFESWSMVYATLENVKRLAYRRLMNVGIFEQRRD